MFIFLMFRWYIESEQIEIVDNFCYLGINFTQTGNMNNAVKKINEQALKAYNNSLYIFSRIPLDIQTKISLFDRIVVPFFCMDLRFGYI